MYSYGSSGARGGGLLQRLASMIPALSATPWQLSLTWHPGMGLSASLFPGVSGAAGAVPGAISPGALAAPFYPGAFYGGAAPYVQAAAMLPMGGALPTAVSPLGWGPFAAPYAQAAAAPFGVSPYWSGAVSPMGALGAFTPAYGVSGTYAPMGSYGAWGPLGAYAASGYAPTTSLAAPGALPYMGAASGPDLAYAPYGGLQ